MSSFPFISYADSMAPMLDCMYTFASLASSLLSSELRVFIKSVSGWYFPFLGFLLTNCIFSLNVSSLSYEKVLLPSRLSAS